jgi:hypothetical protein
VLANAEGSQAALPNKGSAKAMRRRVRLVGRFMSCMAVAFN